MKKEKRPTIHDYFIKYERYVWNTVGYKRAGEACNPCYNLFERFREKKYPEEFFVTDIQDHMDIYVQEGRSSGFVRQQRRSLNCFWEWMKDYVPDIVAYNPTKGVREVSIKAERTKPGRVWILSEEGIPALIGAIKTPTERLLVLGGLVGGLSFDDIVKLNPTALQGNVLSLTGKYPRTFEPRQDLLHALQAGLPHGLTRFQFHERWKSLLHRAGLQHTSFEALRRLLALSLQRYGCSTADILAYMGISQSPRVRTLLEPTKPVPIGDALSRLPYYSPPAAERSE